MNQIKVELQEVMGKDKSIAEAAWTSSMTYQTKKQRSDEDIKRIINMLADNKHSVPFESIIFRFWMKIPIAIDRQICTHRIASHSGMSGRYRTMPSEYLQVPQDVEFIVQKLQSLTYPNPTNTVFQLKGEYYRICEEANNFYSCAMTALKLREKDGSIDNKEYKRLREFFRGVLPQNNMTERVTIMNLRSFCNFQKLRNSEHAQLEIQQVAKLMLEAVKKSNVCPIAIECLEKNEWLI